jgi:hypothetical protein
MRSHNGCFDTMPVGFHVVFLSKNRLRIENLQPS